MGLKRIIIAAEILIIIMLLYMCFTPQVEAEVEPKYFIMLATAYTPGIESCGEWADGFTYTGDVAGKGCVAIDPKAGILKMGQKIFVEGYGCGVCNDIGGAIKGWRIDVCFDNLDEALEWGRRMVRVYVLND